jgi:cation-transporting P-type ATPase C
VLGVVTFRRQGEFEGRDVIGALGARNKRARFVYISSRCQATAETIAAKVGISTVFGDLDPKAKARALGAFGRRAMWIGDGASPEAIPSIEASVLTLNCHQIIHAASALSRATRACLILERILAPSAFHL